MRLPQIGEARALIVHETNCLKHFKLLTNESIHSKSCLKIQMQHHMI